MSFLFGGFYGIFLLFLSLFCVFFFLFSVYLFCLFVLYYISIYTVKCLFYYLLQKRSIINPDKAILFA